jgi:hypothetical protein
MRGKKLKLVLEDLTVDSFAPQHVAGARGTVHAREQEETVFLCTGHTCHESCYWSQEYCHTQDCATDWNTCMGFGSCCPAHCNSGEPW